LAHFVKPLGQSAANDGVATTPSKLAAVLATRAFRFVLAVLACGMGLFFLFMLSVLFAVVDRVVSVFT